jgi:RNA 2',3'-cyclic 3'-phosphodiesterase
MLEGTSMEIRSFLAFELPPDIMGVISHTSGEMKDTPLNVRWVKPGNIHLTMVFMGNMPRERLKPIDQAAADVCRRYGPFKVFLDGTGVFGSRRNPRVLWAALNGDLERMSRFRDELQKDLEPFGIKQERRRFKPHLTFGRFRKGARTGSDLDELLSRYQDLTSPACAVNELVLFKSDLRPGGAVYTRLNAWSLSGRD